MPLSRCALSYLKDRGSHPTRTSPDALGIDANMVRAAAQTSSRTAARWSVAAIRSIVAAITCRSPMTGGRHSRAPSRDDGRSRRRSSGRSRPDERGDPRRCSSQQGARGGARLVVTTDRTSNGPQLLYPRSTSPGGAPDSELWVLDSFERDRSQAGRLLATAERGAADGGFRQAQLDELHGPPLRPI